MLGRFGRGWGRARAISSCRQLVLWPRCGRPSYQFCFVVLCHANSPPLLSPLLVVEVDGCTADPEGGERVHWAASRCSHWHCSSEKGAPGLAWSADDVDSISLLGSFQLSFPLFLATQFFSAQFSAVFLDLFCPTFSRSCGLMTAHVPSAVGVAKAPPPLILFNYIKLQGKNW